jgi:trimethylamine-N-oxide reductase (cytochrome c)
MADGFMDPEEKAGEVSTVLGVGLAGLGPGGAASVADTKNGRIVRLRPLHYDWKYDKARFNPGRWRLAARPSSLR